MSVTATINHSLGAEGIRRAVQNWIDNNWLWPPGARVERFVTKWVNETTLDMEGMMPSLIAGKVPGTDAYTFKAQLTLGPATLSVSASDPPKTYLQAKGAWEDALKTMTAAKDVTVAPLDPKDIGTPSPVFRASIPHNLGQGEALSRAVAAARAYSNGNMTATGNRIVFARTLKENSRGLGEKRIYGIALIGPTSADVVGRLPAGLRGDVMIGEARKYGQTWERMLSKWLGQAPPPAEKKDPPPQAPEKKDPPPQAPEKKDPPPQAPEKKDGGSWWMWALGLGAAWKMGLLGGKKGR